MSDQEDVTGNTEILGRARNRKKRKKKLNMEIDIDQEGKRRTFTKEQRDLNLDERSTIEIDAMIPKTGNLSDQSMQFRHYKNSLVLKLGEAGTEGKYKLADGCGDQLNGKDGNIKGKSRKILVKGTMRSGNDELIIPSKEKEWIQWNNVYKLELESRDNSGGRGGYGPFLLPMVLCHSIIRRSIWPRPPDNRDKRNIR
jgi:hypothetical protein